jgi:hypothetical protein
MRAKIAFFALLFLLNGITLSYAYMPGRDIFSGNIPEPRLIGPVTDKVDLSGSGELLFKWSPHEGNISERRYYDFRLYEGYQMVESNLVFQDNVPANKHQIALDASMFKLNQVYTWSLRQNYRSGKSRRSTSSFTIINK